MKNIEVLFENNKKWSKVMVKKDRDFFRKLWRLQEPQFLWIGCSDSRVPANEIVGLLPGELFVHRNIANIVYGDDLNCLSVLEYAINVLKVRDIIVCGHYNCAGVKAVIEPNRLRVANTWLKSIRDIMRGHLPELRRIKNRERRVDRLCELNVLEQAHNVCKTTFVKEAWRKGEPLNVHAWIYDLRDGLIRELCCYRYPVKNKR